MASGSGRSSKKCLAYIVAAVILQALIIAVFVVLFARVRTPKVRLGSVSIENLNENSNSSNPSFNLKVKAQVTVKNTNFGHYKFENTTATVSYRGTEVGEADIVKARAKARTTKKFDVTFSLHSNKVSSNSQLSNDLKSKNLTFSVHANLHGKVHLLKVFKRKKSAEMNCSFVVDTSAKSIHDLSCK